MDRNPTIKGHWSNSLLMFDSVISIIENDLPSTRFSLLRHLLFRLLLSMKTTHHRSSSLNCLLLCNVIYHIEFIIVLLYYFFFPASKLSNQPHQIPQCWNYACYHDNLGKKSLYFFIFVQLQNESRFDHLIKLRSRNRVKC